MKGNKKLVIITSIVFALVIATVVFAYMFLRTDFFKSNQELFAKYFTQNAQMLKEITDFQTDNIYKNLNYENKYESSTDIKLIHSEGGEVSNLLNNLSAKIDIQKNDEEQYTYADGQILYEDDEYLEAEIIKQEDIYGIRFTDAVKQFITIKKDDNMEVIANDIGISVEQLQILMNIIDGTQRSTFEEEVSKLEDKYKNIVTTISNGIFSKQKNAMITYSNTTTKTNAYTVLLSNEQVEKMLLEILENIKNETQILANLQIIVDKEMVLTQIDEIINKINEELDVPEIKITVYEQKQRILRTILESAGHKIEIENTEQNGELKAKINYSNLNNDYVTQYNCELSKKYEENQENIEIVINVVEGEDNYMITASSEMRTSDNKIELTTDISYKKDITTTSLVFENVVNIGNNFEKIFSLETGNNILISNIKENKRKELMDILKRIVPEKINKRKELLKEKLGVTNEEITETENTETQDEISQVEINKFNSKFEFYTGDQVSSGNVKSLLEIVKNNLSNFENIKLQSEENSESDEIVDEKLNIKLTIEKDIINEDGINKVLEEIEDNKQYKVMIFYKNSNGLIDYITITEI